MTCFVEKRKLWKYNSKRDNRKEKIMGYLFNVHVPKA
uniref:Uncharacterized protein n=1 Tax=Arundo donax TaxID=35708 RepID=A0A0A8ZKU8_ARUDO